MASLKKHSHGIPPTTSLGIVSDLTRSILTQSLVVCYISGSWVLFQGWFYSGRSLFGGGLSSCGQWLVEESEEQRGNSNFLLLGTRKDVIPVEVDTHKKIVLATLATCTPTNNTLSVI